MVHSGVFHISERRPPNFAGPAVVCLLLPHPLDGPDQQRRSLAFMPGELKLTTFAEKVSREKLLGFNAELRTYFTRLSQANYIACSAV